MTKRESTPLGHARTHAAYRPSADDHERTVPAGHSFLHLPPIHIGRWLRQLAGRPAIPRPWLTAVVLLSLGSGLAMFISLGAFVGNDVHSPDTAMVIGPSPPETKRADILMRAGHADLRDLQHPIKSSIEQIDDRGVGIKQFFHVISPLMPVETGKRQVAEDETASRPHVLPNEIVFGTSRPREQHDHARSYAAVGEENVAHAPLVSGEPINLTVIAKSHPAQAVARHLVVARRGDELTHVLQVLGVNSSDARQLSALLTPGNPLRPNFFSGGEKIAVEFDGDQKSRRPLRVGLYRSGRPDVAAVFTHKGMYVLAATPSPFQPSTEALPVKALPSKPSALREGLYAVAGVAHIAREAITDVVEACARDLDLSRPISAGDKAELLYSPDEQGQPVIVFAAIRSGERTDRYYRFKAPDDSSPQYYDANGRAMPLPYLRKPVEDGRLGDGFGWRIHPVLKERKFHQGVDYAAPQGSPIMATSDGVVEKIDQAWGYGKYIRVRHDAHFETTYAHVVGTAAGLHVGDHVRRGQTIAYVGSTGLSTGPHLYYEMRVDGRDIDPLRTNAVADRTLSSDSLTEFQKTREQIDMLLAASVPVDSASNSPIRPSRF